MPSLIKQKQKEFCSWRTLNHHCITKEAGWLKLGIGMKWRRYVKYPSVSTQYTHTDVVPHWVNNGLFDYYVWLNQSQVSNILPELQLRASSDQWECLIIPLGCVCHISNSVSKTELTFCYTISLHTPLFLRQDLLSPRLASDLWFFLREPLLVLQARHGLL